jgi:spermidine synthase
MKMTEKKSRMDVLDLNIDSSNATLSIFLISVLGLFLEMMLIRWIGTEIRIFAYLQNTILVVCFLGLGLGCFTSHKRIDLRSTILPLLFITLLFAIPLSRKWVGKISEMLSAMRDFPIFYSAITTSTVQTVSLVIIGVICSYFVLLLILDIFVPIGRILGRLLDNHPNTIWAYSVNVMGSLVGTWVFVVISILYAPPYIWCSIFVLLLLFFLIVPGRGRIINLSLCLALVILSWFASIEYDSVEVKWSPYQKLVIRESNLNRGEIGKYYINVNNVVFQEILDLRPDVDKVKNITSGIKDVSFSHYDIPLLLHPNPKKMLIVGSGAGNDVAGGLRNGVQEITAVEIDPAIISIGKRYHPEYPYDSSAVRTIINDARSFFATCNDRFDVISFGLLDSHTSPVMTNTRLDEYVFTRESIERAKSLLADGGIIALHSSAMEIFIADRIAKQLRDAFGEDPISFITPSRYGGIGGFMFVAGNLASVREQTANNPNLKAFIEESHQRYPIQFTYNTPISTDDWPYLYLKAPGIPTLYYILTGILILLFVRSCKHWEVSGIFKKWDRSNWHFFFLGAAFMLLEVQNISKASVVLGSTWIVNAIIVSGVLFMILFANLIVYRFKNIRTIPAYIILCIICLILYYIDLASFAFLPQFTKAFLVGSLTTLPMIFSGVIFIRSFANIGEKDKALGANLFGALIGALLQSITFVIGIKALLLIVMVLYILSFFTMPKDLALQTVNFNA